MANGKVTPQPQVAEMLFNLAEYSQYKASGHVKPELGEDGKTQLRVQDHDKITGAKKEDAIIKFEKLEILNEMAKLEKAIAAMENSRNQLNQIYNDFLALKPDTAKTPEPPVEE